jgi:hypothetical protein
MRALPLRHPPSPCSGLWLILFESQNSPGDLVDSFGAGGDGSYLAAFLAAGLIGLYQF